MAGWTIRKRTTAGSGSTYLKLRRDDGAYLTVRVADHDRKDFVSGSTRYDTRTQPADLLRALRRMRYHTVPEIVEPLSDEDEIALANQIVRKLWKQRDAPRPSKDLAGDFGWANGMAPKTDDDKPKRPRPNTMTSEEQLAEIVNAWPQLKASDRSSLLGTLRRTPTIAGRAHVSKMAKATRGQHLMHHTEVTKRLGITKATFATWYEKGWITGKVRVSGNVWYPKTEVTKARRLAEKRSKS